MIYSAPEKEVKFAFGLNMTSDIYKAELNGFGYSPRYIVEQIKYKISFNYTLSNHNGRITLLKGKPFLLH
jgi:hypothetical protein